jgi:hypothetical protein
MLKQNEIRSAESLNAKGLWAQHFRILGFEILEHLMHKQNETRSSESRNAKGLWAQHFRVQDFEI